MNGYFTPDLDTVKETYCDTCNVICNVTRNYEGYRGRMSAMTGIKSRFDLFTCPNRGQEWHEKAYRLICERNQTVSPRLKSIIRDDIDDLVFENTGKHWVEIIDVFVKEE